MKTTVIETKKVISWRDIVEIWEYRELLYFLAWRDFKIRYKQTLVGISWAIFQPLLTMTIFSLFFSRLGIQGDLNIPYPLFVYIGFLFWFLFSGAVSSASESLIIDKSIISKVYFPKIIIPLSSIVVRLIDFFFGLLLLPFLLVFYNILPNLEGVFIFFISVVGIVIFSSGTGLFLSGLNVKYRDVRYILPFFIQILLFITPVFYSVSIIPFLKNNSFINPIGQFIEYTRVALFFDFNFISVFIPLISSIFIFTLGFIYFKKVERYFADII